MDRAGRRTAVVLAGLLAACAPKGPPAPRIQPETAATAPASGYLGAQARPDAVRLLPPPPQPGSPAQARDAAAATAALALRGGARWRLAAADAEVKLPEAAQSFSCALGVRLDPRRAPRLFVLLRRTIFDLGQATYPVKTKYGRPRPFVGNNAPICTPASERTLRADGSYPSGHSALGWGWALILAELAPDRADAILARGRAFGQSRVVCNLHWQSDVEEGRIVGAAVVARLHAEAPFRSDLEAARAELAALREAGRAPAGDCASEAAILAAG